MRKPVEICVYGAENLCPSCVNSPSAKDTFEWLEAALTRKYPDQPFDITYIDIYCPPEDEEKKKIADQIVKEEYFYPLVVINGVVVGEGNPKIKRIFQEMEKNGYQPV
ncbi:disulfide oxidoreductase [Aeribacillus pallidus]|uniref:Disulfide oxidoreductase n=1 Tax=Aeribacillus pallidus TaxID=33936 RepID=A0A165YNE0_9BACI|nr:YuzD family protein [Aeribacillus pallidus]KZN97276.1 disulfide oxidoreductase [Aeribacillus pallidus]